MSEGLNVDSLLNAGWFSLLVSSAIGLLGILTGYILYRRSKQVNRLRYLVGDAQLIGVARSHHAADGLEVRFDGEVVHRVTVTSYGIWNDGTTTIHGHDIVDRDPLRLEFPDSTKLLRGYIGGCTREVIAPEMTKIADNRLAIKFDYLDPGDGFRVQVLHSGPPGSAKTFGSVRGLPRGPENFKTSSVRWYLEPLSRAWLIVPLALATCVAFAVYSDGGSVYFILVPFAAVWLTALVTVDRSVLSARGVPDAISQDAILGGWSLVKDEPVNKDTWSRS